MAADPWRSERLVYRTIETQDDEFLYELGLDGEAFINSAPFVPTPRALKDAASSREWLASKLIGAIIFLPNTNPFVGENPPKFGSEEHKKWTVRPPDLRPIGYICLSDPPATQAHHRHGDIGITLHRDFRGQGYGGEAIRWCLDWGFRRANLHRIGIGAFAYNTGSVRLYERMGFTLEGRKRDFLWHDGAYHDLVEFGMLEDEWRALQQPKDSR